MKYYLIAGEASGDMHAANLIRAIRENDPAADFRAFGGDRMIEAGAFLFIHYRDMALMGGIEVVKKLGTIYRNKRTCRKDILEYKPDVLILVDYSGFNLPMARFATAHGIRVIYYISPKLWAWAKWRVRTVKEAVLKMFVMLPFEIDFYRTYDIQAEYYGNPVLDSITEFERRSGPSTDFYSVNHLEKKPIIALLAGSRKQEISLLLPEMLSAAAGFPGYQFVIAGAPAIDPGFYGKITGGSPVSIVYGQTYDLLMHSTAAVVTSGTATLETALLRVPQVVVYKTSPLTFFIGNFFVRVKYFSLVNLIMDRPVVKELLQEGLAGNIRSELELLLSDEGYRAEMLDNYSQLREKLGEPGVAGRVARRIDQILKTR